MSNNKQLPADFQNDLERLIERHTLKLPNDNDYQIGFEKGVEKGIEIGATTYAAKLHQVEQEKKNACDTAILMTNKNNECQAKLWDAYREIEKARDLLKEIISVCGDTLIHHTDIANEIKQFLDGTK